MSHSKTSEHLAVSTLATEEAVAPQSTVAGGSVRSNSEAPAEWGEEQRSCTRRRSDSAVDPEDAREWAEDQAWCVLNAVTIAGAG